MMFLFTNKSFFPGYYNAFIVMLISKSCYYKISLTLVKLKIITTRLLIILYKYNKILFMI